MKTQSCSRILWLLTLQNPIGTQFVSGLGTWSVLYELIGKAWVNVDRLFCHIMSHYRLYKLLLVKKFLSFWWKQEEYICYQGKLNEVDFKSDYVRFLFLIATVVNRNEKNPTPLISKTSKSFCKIAANNYFVSFIAWNCV